MATVPVYGLHVLLDELNFQLMCIFELETKKVASFSLYQIKDVESWGHGKLFPP